MTRSFLPSFGAVSGIVPVVSTRVGAAITGLPGAGLGYIIKAAHCRPTQQARARCRPTRRVPVDIL